MAQTLLLNLRYGVMFCLITSGASVLGWAIGPSMLEWGAWPAAGMMLWLLIRYPVFGAAAGWIGAGLGLWGAGLMLGQSPAKAGLEVGVTLCGVFVAWQVLTIWRAPRFELRSPLALLWLGVALSMGGMASAAISSMIEVTQHQRPIIGHFACVWTGYLLGYALTVPILLIMPPISNLAILPSGGRRMRRTDAIPLIILLLSFALALALGGGGAFVLPLLVLAWCGLSYAAFPTICASTILGYLVLICLDYGQAEALPLVRFVWLRLILAVWLLVPLMISILRRRGGLQLPSLIRRPRPEQSEIAIRAAFRNEASRLMEAGSYPLSVLRLRVIGGEEGLDYAKKINRSLRKRDILTEVSPREFVILLGNCGQDQVRPVIDRLDGALKCDVAGVETFTGVASDLEGRCTLEQLIEGAELALLRAQRVAPDRIAFWNPPNEPAGLSRRPALS